MSKTTEMPINLLRKLALMQHLGEDYFIIYGDDREDTEDEIFEGTEEDARERFKSDIEGTEEADIDVNFRIFCGNNLVRVEELEDDDNYMVLTDEEADEKWDEYLDSYIDECLEIPDNIRQYFDDEKWKNDARMDGRGHCLSSYDGHEHEEEVEGFTFYIYRTN